MKLQAMERASVWMPVLAIQFFMFFTEEGLAIQYYQCSNDDTSTFCNDPFNPNLDGVTKCEGKSCSKVKYKERSGRNFVQDLKPATIYSKFKYIK